MIPLSVPHIAGNEWTYIKECLDTEWVSSAGKYVNNFEEDICRYSNAKYAVCCVNGTAALQIALLTVGVKAEEEVIVPTVTFIATINVVRYVNAIPIFMDCDDYYNIDLNKTMDFIENNTIFKSGSTYNKSTGRRIAAIIPVHIYGNAVNFDEYLDELRSRNIKIVEDATESIGTFYTEGIYRDKYSGTVGDIGCFSFNGNKIITTGGGGMIVTNNQKYADMAKYLTTQAKDDDIYYVHNDVGYNYRLTNIQAAMGVAQLEKLDEYISIKEKNYSLFKDKIDQIDGLRIADVPSYARSNYWFYCLRTDKSYGTDINELIRYLAENDIQVRPIWKLNHMQKPYKGSENYKIEKAYSLYKNTLNIPCSVNLTQSEVAKVIKTLKDGKR